MSSLLLCSKCCVCSMEGITMEVCLGSTALSAMPCIELAVCLPFPQVQQCPLHLLPKQFNDSKLERSKRSSAVCHQHKTWRAARESLLDFSYLSPGVSYRFWEASRESWRIGNLTTWTQVRTRFCVLTSVHCVCDQEC